MEDTMVKRFFQAMILVLVFCVPFTRYQQVDHKWTRTELDKFKKTVGVVAVNYMDDNVAEGACVIVRKDGTALTAGHLFTHGQVKSIQMIAKNGNWYDMVLLDINFRTDIAVIRPKAASPTFEFSRIKRSNRVNDNTTIVAIGHPLFHYWWATSGIVLRTVYSPYYTGDIVHITALVQPGNSGGPIFDPNGEVVGIVSAYHTNLEGQFDYGVAVGLREINKLLARSDSREPYRRPQIRKYSIKELK